MKEYIVPIDERARNFDEIFIGVLRTHDELIRCNDCRYFEDAMCGEGYCNNPLAINDCVKITEHCSRAEERKDD